MFAETIDEISRKINELLPEDAKRLQQDFDKNLRSLVQSSLSKLDLVTREEFDVQTQVLYKTRQQLKALQQRLDALEQTSNKPE